MDLSGGMPKSINPDPIIDYVIELRFSSSFPENAVFGLVFDKVKEGYPNFKSTNLPQEIRQKELGLRYYPEAYISNENFNIGISKNSFVISGGSSYKGWQIYSTEVKRLIGSLLSDRNLIKSVERLGLRYVNFFPGVRYVEDVAELNYIFSNMADYSKKASNYRIELVKDDIGIIMNCSDNATINGKPETGSVIDLDLFCGPDIRPESPDIFALLGRLHDEEKRLFYSLLKSEAVAVRSPEY